MNNVPVNDYDIERAIRYLELLRGTDSLVARLQRALHGRGTPPMTSAQSLALIMDAMRYVTDRVIEPGFFDHLMAGVATAPPDGGIGGEG